MNLARIGQRGSEQPVGLGHDGTPAAGPGHVTNTHTPADVALGRPGGGQLHADGTMRLEFDGLGVQQRHLGAT